MKHRKPARKPAKAKRARRGIREKAKSPRKPSAHRRPRRARSPGSESRSVPGGWGPIEEVTPF